MFAPLPYWWFNAQEFHTCLLPHTLNYTFLCAYMMLMFLESLLLLLWSNGVSICKRIRLWPNLESSSYSFHSFLSYVSYQAEHGWKVGSFGILNRQVWPAFSWVPCRTPKHKVSFCMRDAVTPQYSFIIQRLITVLWRNCRLRYVHRLVIEYKPDKTDFWSK